MTWQEQARCNPGNSWMFDPINVVDKRPGGHTDKRRIHAAIVICCACPVRVKCLDEAFANRDSGVRGGVLLNDGKPDSRAPRVAA